MGGTRFSFDEEAASWDKNPGKVTLANTIADAVIDENILAPAMDVLEFGCGTGLLTLRLQPLVRSITGVDSSPGMLAVLRAKIEDRNLANIELQLIDPAKDTPLQGNYDLVVSSMTLHHVKKIAPLISEFFKLTAPNGYLCIADLDLDNGRFHGENDTVFHNGFDREVMRRLLEESGYVDIHDRTAATVKKPGPDGEMHGFDVFLITARKPAVSD
jgi:ubiquinone/menaquinone biosynthesis C-methylase UbiE